MKFAANLLGAAVALGIGAGIGYWWHARTSAGTSPQVASATTTSSTIESGAGSVGDSERPIFPNTRSTSGKLRSSRSIIWRTRLASVIEMPGEPVGM